MKINFHYFTIKYIASRSGYSDQEAQLIASTCQFINENNEDVPVYLQKDQLSEGILKRHLYQEEPSKGQGMCKVPMLLTAIDEQQNTDAWKAELENRANQTERLIPFNYFPDLNKQKPWTPPADDYRITPIQNLQSSPAFNQLFQRAALHYKPSPGDLQPSSVQALRRLGALLHIATDSFAYVPFNGYKSQVNDWKIIEVKDSRTFEDITKKYDPNTAMKNPNVGKFRTSSVCDDYNIQFILSNLSLMNNYTRLSNDYFIKIAKAVYGFLCVFAGGSPSDQNWRDNILPGLLKGWNTDAVSYTDLHKHWSEATGSRYDYDADATRQAIVDIDESLKPDQQGYFDFLLLIQDVRDAVEGKLQEVDEMLSGQEQTASTWSCEISDPNFTGDDYELNFSATLPTKLNRLQLILTIINTDTQEQVTSKSYEYKSVRSINEKVVLSIPDDTQPLMARLAFSWTDSQGQQQKLVNKTYTLTGNAEVVDQTTLLAPVSRTGRPSIQIVNGTTSTTADYSYPMNAMYISQEGKNQLDLYTPIDMQIKLKEGFKLMDSSDVHIRVVPSSGGELRYCNNSKFISLEADPDTGFLHLKAVEEWKNHLFTTDFGASIAKMKLIIQATLEVSSDQEEGYRNIQLDTGSDAQLVTAMEYLWNL